MTVRAEWKQRRVDLLMSAAAPYLAGRSSPGYLPTVRLWLDIMRLNRDARSALGVS